MAGISNYQYTNNPLITAVRNQDTDLVKKLLAEGANPNVLDNEGRTPLILAKMFSIHPTLYKDTGIYNQLLLAGADQNIRDDFGFDADDYGYVPVRPDFEKKKKEFNTLKVAAILKEIHPEANIGNVYDQLDVDTMKDFNDYSGGKKRRKTIRRRKTIKRRKTIRRRKIIKRRK